MPLSEHEQQILDEIERRLQQEDPRLASAASTSLQRHLVRRIRWGAAAFVVGFFMLLLFAMSVWVAIGGFAVMLASGLFVYHHLKQVGQGQLRDLGSTGRFSLAGYLARLTERFRGNQQNRG